MKNEITKVGKWDVIVTKEEGVYTLTLAHRRGGAIIQGRNLKEAKADFIKTMSATERVADILSREDAKKIKDETLKSASGEHWNSIYGNPIPDTHTKVIFTSDSTSTDEDAFAWLDEERIAAYRNALDAAKRTRSTTYSNKPLPSDLEFIEEQRKTVGDDIRFDHFQEDCRTSWIDFLPQACIYAVSLILLLLLIYHIIVFTLTH